MDDTTGTAAGSGTETDTSSAGASRATTSLADPDAPAIVVADELEARYGDGDTEERIRVLGILDRIADERPVPDLVRAVGVDLTRDALRANDPRLVAAAMGPFAGRHLGDHDWRHGVVKLVFMGVPLSGVARLEERADDELARMAADLAEERTAAGRPIPDDLRALLPVSTDATREPPAATRPGGR
jgi:hypothetical protein